MVEPARTLDISVPRVIHVTNVGGAGMSAVATLLAEMGHQVTGHDPLTSSPFLGPLEAVGVGVRTGPETGDLKADVEAVVISTATPRDHPHLVAARARSIPVWHRSDALAALCARRHTIAVAGTHGKTTTSALLATILASVGAPGWVVGAGIPGLGRSASWGGDGMLVVEADESDGTFLALGARAAIVTNVEPDHLEHWGGESELRAAFVRFVSALDGPAVLCADDAGSAALTAAAVAPVTYGQHPASDYRVADIAIEGTGVMFSLHHGDQTYAVHLPAAPGVHNARNAAGAIAMAHSCGVEIIDAVAALAGFRGVARRFEVRGEAAGVVLVDSYDHLPTEVSAALAAAAAGSWQRIVCVFQPHRFSRTAALGRSFADAFAGADVLAVTDIYAAGEAPRPGVTGKLVVDAVLDAHPWQHVAWLPTLEDVVQYLGTSLRPGDLCLTLGAGDLTTIPDRVVAALEARHR